MKPVKCKDFPGYYEISGFSNYCINKNSDILIKSKNRIINQYKCYNSGTSKKETGYYLRVTMYDDDKKLRSITVHRLMALTFKFPKNGIKNLQVNHIDGVKSNNTIENLEWITCKKNIKLANIYYGTRVKIPVQLKHKLDGKIINFETVGEAAKFLNIHRTTLISRLEKFKSGFVFPDGYAVRYGNDNSSWELSTKSEEEVDMFYSKPMLIKNLITNEIIEVPTLKDARKYIPFNLGTLSEISNDVTQPSVWGINGHLYLIIKKYPKKEFRAVKDPYKDIVDHQTNTRLVVAINVKTNEKRIYATTQQCANDFGLKKTTLNYRLRMKKPKTFNNWLFSYYENQGPLNRK